MTYKDCIHNEICVFRGKGDCPDSCAQFKYKARFVELPIKAGESIYRICGNTVSEWVVPLIEVYEEEICFVDDTNQFFEPKDIGETVFLTREEAEKALENMKNERR